MTKKPYLIDAIVGNSRMLASLTRDAEIQRLFWPHIDGPQHVERLIGGLSLNGEPVCWQDDPSWQHSQAYEADQNILITTSNHSNGLEMITTDTAIPNQELLVRQLRFTNRSAAPITLQYILYQWLRVDENPLYNTVLFHEEADGLAHFRRDLYFMTGADQPLTSFLIDYPEQALEAASSLAFHGGTVLHGDVAGAGLWNLGSLAPGESTGLTLFLAMGRSLQESADRLSAARAAGTETLLNQTRTYWTEWLAQAKPITVAEAEAPERTAFLPGLPAEAASPAQVEQLYRRSLLMFKLMSDEQTGAVIAAPEFDPAFTACGGYAYCWGRDAAYITTAMDLAGYHELAASFYRWAVKVQEPEGWWMHRHYTSGDWGPSWGLIQVDETGSILYGMALHARIHGGELFVHSVWQSVTRAADWLIQDLDPATGLPKSSVDLWEERSGEHTYSCGAVYGGLAAAAEMARTIGQAEHAQRYQEAADQLQAAILRESVRDGRFLRGRLLEVSKTHYQAATAAGEAGVILHGPKGHPIYLMDEDPVPDASLLGMSTPFGVVEATDPTMVATVKGLVESLWTSPIGGMRRYVADPYRNGNPWILTTLWLGQYEADRGNRELARQIIDWAVARMTETELLAEQVDPTTGEPAWVLPLTWSHAMYVLLVLKLYS